MFGCRVVDYMVQLFWLTCGSTLLDFVPQPKSTLYDCVPQKPPNTELLAASHLTIL